MNLVYRFLIVITLSMSPIVVFAQEWVYSTGSNTDAVHRVNLETGDVEFVGSVHPDVDRYTTPIDIAIRPSDGAMYIVNNSPLEDAGLSQFYGPSRLPELIIPRDQFCGTVFTLYFTPDDRLILPDSCGRLYEVFLEDERMEQIGTFRLIRGLSYNLVDRGIYGLDVFNRKILRLRQDGSTVREIPFSAPASGATVSGLVVTGDGRFLVSTASAIYEVDVDSGALTMERQFPGPIWPQGLSWQLPFQPPPPYIQTMPVNTLHPIGLTILILGFLFIPIYFAKFEM